MRYGIFSDVHANYEAFEAVQAFYKTQTIDSYIFLGDIIGYGPSPSECISLLISMQAVCIIGNHDAAATNKFSLTYFNEYARRALIWTKASISSRDSDYLNTFVMTCIKDGIFCLHGNPRNPQKFNYLRNCHDAKDAFSCFSEKLCFLGHSHKPESYIYDGKNVTRSLSQNIKVKPRCRYVINVGSVGQPRDENPYTCCCIYDSNTGIITFARLAYDIDGVAKKIIDRGLSSVLAMRLYGGY